MNQTESPAATGSETKTQVGTDWWLLSIGSVILPWLSQPPLAWWPFAALAVVPFLLAASAKNVSRRRYLVLYGATTVYWALTLQGLRYANPLIYPCWIALAAYLAIYPVWFVVVLRRMLKRGMPMIIAAPFAWVGMECVRSYLLTGISAALLGHTLADVPSMIQIADLGGTYAVSFVIVAVNVAIFKLGVRRWRASSDKHLTDDSDGSGLHSQYATVAIAVALCLATFVYGRYRLNQPTTPSQTTVALIGRNEPVEYAQDHDRELELFDAYAKESIRTIESTDQKIDVVVWPESMFTGTIPWSFGEGGGAMAREAGYSLEEERAMIAEHQRRFQFRAAQLQGMLAKNNGPDNTTPHILGGCGVVDYSKTTKIYSGIVHIDPTGTLKDWYGKTHLVMFGEYIPLVKQLPIVRNWVPKNLGLTSGPSAKRFRTGDLTLCPNICIETAVERVPINHLRELHAAPEPSLPDAIITVTNDAWFDDSSVVQHHKRCAQLVAVACRRPILSAANNGPTVWIDSCGRVVDELPQGGEGNVVAQPAIDKRTSLVLLIGDWPARIAAFVFVFSVMGWRTPHSNDQEK